jgi:DNA-binding GntR family transcriptional regulator
VYGRLRSAIVDGTFAPGEQLRDVELATWLGVSRSTTVSSVDVRAVRDARDVVAAMHEVAVREAVESLTEEDLEAMREANERFREAVDQGDLEAALSADDDLHGVPVAVAANRALIRLCAAGDAEGAAAVAYDTLHSLPVTETGEG